jgi:hypothetical protein
LTAGELILQAKARGVVLCLIDGKVKARGPREAVNSLLRILRENRDALANALLAGSKTVRPSPEQCSGSAPSEWDVLDGAYMAHLLNCPICVAAGRGSQYGLRCGTGASLWRANVGR